MNATLDRGGKSLPNAITARKLMLPRMSGYDDVIPHTVELSSVSVAMGHEDVKRRPPNTADVHVKSGGSYISVWV